MRKRNKHVALSLDEFLMEGGSILPMIGISAASRSLVQPLLHVPQTLFTVISESRVMIRCES